MSNKTKLVLALGFVGAVAVAAAAFAQTGAPSHSPTHDSAGAHAFGHGFGKRLVHSESKIQMPDGSFATAIIDRGDITKVDGNTVTIKRVDGESVSVTGTAGTKVRRNAEQSTFSALKTGDHAMILQLVQNGTTTVKLVRAFSPDFTPKEHHRRPHDRPGGDNTGDATAAVFDI